MSTEELRLVSTVSPALNLTFGQIQIFFCELFTHLSNSFGCIGVASVETVEAKGTRKRKSGWWNMNKVVFPRWLPPDLLEARKNTSPSAERQSVPTALPPKIQKAPPSWMGN